MLQQLYFYQHKIRLLVKSAKFTVSRYPYHLFHGLLGEVLYEASGHTHKEFLRCNNPACAYCRLFKPVLPDGHFWKGKYTNPPVGYVLVPPVAEKKEYRQGEKITLTLVLIGQANGFLPQIVSAFASIDMLSQQGVRSNFSFGSFETLCPKMQAPENDNRFTVNNCDSVELDSRSILKIISPLFLSSKKALVENNVLEHLLSQARLKYRLFEQFYCGVPFSALENTQIEPLSYNQETNTIQWWRADNKNSKDVSISALEGRFTKLGNNFENYKNTLKLVQYLGIGQYSSYGMGRIKVM